MSIFSLITAVSIGLSLGLISIYVFKKFKLCREQVHESDPLLAWHSALDVLDDAIILTDNDDVLVHANQSFFDHIKLKKEDLIGKKIHKIFHKGDAYKKCGVCLNRMGKLESTITREVYESSNPFPFPVDVVVRNIQNNNGEIIGVLQTFHNISHIRQSEKELRKSQNKLAEAQKIGRMGHWEWNVSDDTFDWSEEMWRLFGSPDVESNKSGYYNFMALIHDDDRALVRDSIQLAIKNKNHRFILDHRIALPDGGTRNIRHQGKLTYSNNDSCVRLAGVTQDITTQKSIEHALQAEKEKAQVTLQSIGDAVLTMDVNGIIDYVNPVAVSLLMLPANELIGKHHKDVISLFDEKTRQPIDDPLHRSLLHNKEVTDEHIILFRPDKSEVSISMTSAPIIIKGKLVTGVTLVIHDITEMRVLSKQLSFQASHDELTGLVNRREFECRLKNAIESARNTGQHHCLIYMDLDQFKIVNDTCGHLAGDELLKQISKLLMSKIRDIDTLARLGGDEFAVLLKSCTLVSSERVAEVLRRAVENFRFLWDNKVFKIGVSIGLVPVTLESGNQIEIMRRADSACYVAKDKGRNRIYICDADSESLDTQHGEMQWVQKVRQALEANAFELFSQTIKPIANQGHAHFEILLRLNDGNGNYIKPDTFIPAAERYQLMPIIDRWVIDNTLDKLKSMPMNMNWDSYVCGINLSGQSLTDTGLLEFITNKLDETGIDPKNICFEITETTAIANLTDAGRFIDVLRDMGIRFSLDDFGSGLSSFEYLKKLKVDYLKIDGSFIKDIIQDQVNFAMVKSINQIGHLMGVKTVAEFVENEDIMRLLIQMKVDYAQGYHIAIPIPLTQYLYINKHRKVG